MKIDNTRKYVLKTQLAICILTVGLVASVCFVCHEVLGYRTVALILLMTVSLIAMLFEIIPVLVASILSALIWNFLFIPPIFTFHINNTEDLLMFILYFVIAMLNAVLTFQIRKQESKARDQEEKENTIKLYNTLLNSLSHELRTPVSTILSSIDTLKEQGERLDANSKIDILNHIDIASIRLNRQIENLLNMSRLESGTLKLKIEWTDINDLIYSTLDKLKPYAEHHVLEYQSSENLPLCKVDIGIFEQLIYNILFNAIQYTNDGTKISIAIEIKDQNLHLLIQDNGQGIPEEYLPYIFEKFYRLPNSKTGGTGLGLSIVKGFVEAHSGGIEAYNSSPHGLVFKIVIPVQVTYLNHLKNE